MHLGSQREITGYNDREVIAAGAGLVTSCQDAETWRLVLSMFSPPSSV